MQITGITTLYILISAAAQIFSMEITRRVRRISWKRSRRIKIHIFQQLIALVYDLVVIVQVVEIELIQLTQFHIHKSSSLRRTILNDA